MLLLHGLAGHAGEWSETATWLTGNHRALALDQRGHGLSTHAPKDVSREAHVADVAFVIDQLNLGPVVLIGQSLGGNLAFLVAARHPDLVSGLLVAETSPDADPLGESAERLRRWLEGWPTPFPSREAALSFFGGASLYASAWTVGWSTRRWMVASLRGRGDGAHPARGDPPRLLGGVGVHPVSNASRRRGPGVPPGRHPARDGRASAQRPVCRDPRRHARPAPRSSWPVARDGRWIPGDAEATDSARHASVCKHL